MSFWKILGGAALGVGAIAAAPFTGGGSLLGAATLASSLAGAGTIAAAVGAGAVGAAAGAYFDDDDDIREEGRRRGEQEANARHTKDKENLQHQIAELMSSVEKRENLLLTMFAVGICAANADHEICDAERSELMGLVAGIGEDKTISKVLKNKIDKYYNTPPNLPTVWKLIEKHGFNDPEHIKIFSQIVHMVVDADNHINDDELEFIDAWDSLVA
ncbi:hypothetical protein C3737_04390 [Aeromonas jandaei]|uniref:hypothetical protein n=1 Tax=Aeromonas jandaei TaxID=650 RepID=UPI000CE24F50|nr:hypothetical protein [Aeromonas jandaei]PPA31416.1 hypothetical protein C3737_04390 [Aeromonas jandaei]